MALRAAQVGYLNLKAVLTDYSTTVGPPDQKFHPTKFMAHREFSRSRHMTMGAVFANAHLQAIGKFRLPPKERTRV